MSLKIRFVTDYVCPYCLAAKMPLLEAIKGKDIEVEFLPYEVTQEPSPRVDTYHDEGRREKWAKTLAPAVKALGIDMKLPPKVIPRPYTRLAFEGSYYAREHGLYDAYNDRMYTAYFSDEMDIGNLDVLCELAGEIGLDAADFRAALETGTYTERQKAAVAYAKNELDVHSVPTIFIGDTRVEGGIYTKDGFEKLIQDSLYKENEAQKDEAHVIKGVSCDINGCSL